MLKFAGHEDFTLSCPGQGAGQAMVTLPCGHLC